MTDLFKEIIPSILKTKDASVYDQKAYNAFVVNKALSFHRDCLMQANEMNRYPSTDSFLQFHYLLNSIRSYKRPFAKWQKRETVENLEAVKTYYNYSNEKAREAINILSDDQINEIKKNTDIGGLNVRHKRIDRGETT